MKINLGCGRKILENFINVDCIKGDGVDKIMDLDIYPWDFEESTVDEIYADNIIEHLDYLKSTHEIHRILKKDGRAVIKVPYFSNPGAFFADHMTFFNFDSYNKYCINMNPGMDLGEFLFELESRRITFIDEYKSGLSKLFFKLYYFIPKLAYKINPKIYIWFFSYMFPASEIHFVLKKI